MSRYERDSSRDDRRYSDRPPRKDYRDERDSGRDRYSRSSRDHDDRRPARREDDRGYGRPRDDYHRGSREDRGGSRHNSGGRDFDNRGPPRGGPGRLDAGPRQQRERTRSPVRPKEPTPDLETIVPINERKRRQTMWDIKPRGYEAVTAEQAKMSGLFPLPGAPRTAGPVDEAKLKAFAEKGALALKPADLQPTTSRQARRLVVSNIPPLTEEGPLVAFFNDIMYNLNVGSGRLAPCMNAHINKEKAYALVEFRSSEEATCAMAFDGTVYNDSELQIRRPKDYIIPEAREQDTTAVKREDGVLDGKVPDSPNKIIVRGLPIELTDDQCIELLKSFGELRSFMLIKDVTTEVSKGFAFCEFIDETITDIACEGLNGMELGESTLSVTRASIGAVQPAAEGTGLQAISALAESSKDLAESNVLVLFNLVTSEELNDATEYAEICEDVKDECAKFGNVIDLKIPRPLGGSKVNPGVGKVFVRYDSVESCTKALKTLAGRKFADRTVLTSYYPEENYEVDAF